jgi:quinol monooxygenase YgiN
MDETYFLNRYAPAPRRVVRDRAGCVARAAVERRWSRSAPYRRHHHKSWLRRSSSDQDDPSRGAATHPPLVAFYDRPVIFITAKFRVKPEHADRWADITREFTEATRAEPGNLWFEWSRSIDDPSEYVLVEAFRDGEAGGQHVQSEHFKAAMETLPAHLLDTPRIVSQMIDQDDWSELGEMRVR